MADSASYDVSISFMSLGIVGSFYKGIIAMGTISGKFRVLITMLQETLIDMIPFTIILIFQILLFTILSKSSLLAARTFDMIENREE